MTLAGAQVACPCPEYPGGKMLKDVGTELQHTHHQLRRAAICFREAAARDPGDGQAWSLLAGALLSEERFLEAAEAYGKVVSRPRCCCAGLWPLSLNEARALHGVCSLSTSLLCSSSE